MIQAIIFDMDGLLLDSEVYWTRARAEYCRSQGCTWSHEDELSVKGHNSPEWAAVIKRRCSLDVPFAAIIDDVSSRMKSLYADHLPLLPGAVETVRDLHERYPLGLASSSPVDLIEFALREAGIRDCFSVLVSADEVGKGKPAPDVFLVTARRLGFPPSSIAVFEDSSAGIRAGRAAGMLVIAVPNPNFPPSEEALSLASVALTSLVDFSPDLLGRLDSPEQA